MITSISLTPRPFGFLVAQGVLWLVLAHEWWLDVMYAIPSLSVKLLVWDLRTSLLFQEWQSAERETGDCPISLGLLTFSFNKLSVSVFYLTEPNLSWLMQAWNYPARYSDIRIERVWYLCEMKGTAAENTTHRQKPRNICQQINGSIPWIDNFSLKTKTQQNPGLWSNLICSNWHAMRP